MTHIDQYSKANASIRKIDIITQEDLGKGDLVEIYASYIKSPTSLMSDRVTIDAKYLWQ